MKKLIYILTIVPLLFACEKDSFNYKMYDLDPMEIDSVFLSPGTPNVLGDGKAAVSFVVEAFRTIQFELGDELVDSLVAVDINRLPANSIKIFDENGTNVGHTYVPEASNVTKEFYAQIGEAESETKQVEVYTTDVSYDKKYVNVVFHTFELRPDDVNYDPLSYQKIKYERFEQVIDDLNKVFNNQLGNAPNAGSANIEFRLAPIDQNGSKLKTPGYTEILYGQADASGNSVSVTDLIKKINSYRNGYYIWKPEEFLNIYVMPVGASSGLGNQRPLYQNVDEANAMPGMGQITNESTIEKTYINTCGAVPRSIFFPGPDKRITIVDEIGKYYGLYATRFSSAEGDDYCNDTQNYLGQGQYNSILKTGLDGEKFRVSNAMDDRIYPSYRNHITIEQAKRVRFAIEHCPGRTNALND